MQKTNPVKMPYMDSMDTMDTMGQRLQRAIEESEGVNTPAALARMAKTTDPTIANWLQGRVQPEHAKGKLMLRICSILNIRPEWLLDGRGPMRPTAEMPGEYTIVPMYASRWKGGEGAVSADVDTRIGGLHFLRRSLQSRGLDESALRVVFAEGRSMAPRIQPGDALLVDTSKTDIVDGKVYLVEAPDPKGRMVKRLFVETDGRVRIKSDNDGDPEFAPWWVMPDDPNFTIVGRVVWTAGWTT